MKSDCFPRMNHDRYLRSFRILDLLTRQAGGLRLSDIRSATGLPASSVHNVLQTMVAAEVLTVGEDLRYGIGPRMVGLAQATVNSLDLRTLARPLLTALAREIGHDVYLAMRLGRRVFYVDRCQGEHRLSLDVQIGVPLYLHSTATGKLFSAFDRALQAQVLQGPLPRLTERTLVDAQALAADLQAIRRRGWSVSLEETVDGIVGYAVPVWSSARTPEPSSAPARTMAAALHVSVIGTAAERTQEARVVAAARACAGRIAQRLAAPGLRPEPAPAARRNFHPTPLSRHS